MDPVDVVQIGIGPLGRIITNYIAERPSLRVIGAVDVDPAVHGQDLGVLCGLPPMDVTVQSSLEACLETARPQVAILTTVSTMAGITHQIETILNHGLSVVSTCEELICPWDEAPELAARIDQSARAAGCAVLGTGVNPGFLMDSLPAFLTAVCQRVDAVKVSRIQDATFRRIPFQKKIGAGLTLKQFEARKADGSLRHVGLTESMRLVARALGWKIDRTEDLIGPVVSERDIRTEALRIPAGHVAGVEQIGRAWVDGEKRITLIFRAAVGQGEPHDKVEIIGHPDITSVIPGGVNGDVATCAITLNAVKAILLAPPGLRTMAEMPPAPCFA